MSDVSPYATFIEQRQQLLGGTSDAVLKKHFQAEIDLVASWGQGVPPLQAAPPQAPPVVAPVQQVERTVAPAVPAAGNGPAGPVAPVAAGPQAAPASAVPMPAVSVERAPAQAAPAGASTDFRAVPHGYAPSWNTVRFSNTTAEPIEMQITMGAGQPLPPGADAAGRVTIAPGQFVDLTFAPGTNPNFKSTRGGDSVWNQGELNFEASTQIVWGNMSYIYGANSNMRIFSQDGQHSGYQGDIFAKAPPEARVAGGIMAPYDRYHHSDDPANPGSATAGPDGARNAGAKYLYDMLAPGEGYVHRGRPAQINDYDDQSSLRFTGRIAVVF